MKTLSLITLILLLTTPVFSQEIPFHKQPDKQIHFFSTLFILSPVFYTGAYKLTDGNKLKAALWSTLAVGVVGAGYELIHDKAMGKGDPSVGDFAAVMLGHVPILLTATFAFPNEKQKAKRLEKKVKRKKKRANRKLNRRK